MNRSAWWQWLLFVALGALSCTANAQTDSLVLVSPIGGEIFYTNRDSLVPIRWGGVSDTALVRLEWSTDGRKWTIIVDSVSGFQYSWKIVGLPVSSTYRVRVVQARPPVSTDNVTYTGHSAAVGDGAWAPMNDRVVTVSAFPDIWDPTIGGPVPILSLGSDRVKLLDVNWTADSSKIWVTGLGTYGLTAFTTSDNAKAWSYTCNCDQFKTVVGKSGTRAVHAGLRSVYIIDYPNPSPTRQILSTTDVLDVALDSAETHALVCADQASVYTILGGLPVVFRQHSGGVLRGAFHPDGKSVATIGGDATLRYWNATTATEYWNAQDSAEGVRSLAFSPDGTHIAVGMSDSSVTVWNTADGTLLTKFIGIVGAVREVAWDPQGDLIVTAGDDNAAHVFSLPENKRIFRLSHQNDVTSAHWSPNGSSVMTTSLDGTAKVWRIREVLLQADTSGLFSYAPPPPAFARFHTTGGSLPIGNEITLSILLENASKLDLADIDSVQFRLSYDASMLFRTESSIPVVDSRDSAYYRIITLAPIPLPFVDGVLGTIRFRATLGADSITALRIDNLKQIGSGVSIRVETIADTVTVSGICRANNSARLYSPIGLPLNAIVRQGGGSSRLEVQFGEAGPARIDAYTVLGERCWSTQLMRMPSDAALFAVNLDDVSTDHTIFFVITTATQVVTLAAENVR